MSYIAKIPHWWKQIAILLRWTHAGGVSVARRMCLRRDFCSQCLYYLSPDGGASSFCRAKFHPAVRLGRKNRHAAPPKRSYLFTSVDLVRLAKPAELAEAMRTFDSRIRSSRSSDRQRLLVAPANRGWGDPHMAFCDALPPHTHRHHHHHQLSLL